MISQLKSKNLKKIFSTLMLLSSMLIGLAQPTNWQSRGMGGGGALFSPSINPHNNAEIYMACDMTEIFHSLNFGRSWEVLHFEELLATQESKVQFTIDPKILFSIHNDFATDTRIPKKSLDGGRTWKNIQDPTSGEALYLFADPNTKERLLIGTWDKIYFSEDGGNSYNAVYSSSDLYIGGVFWNGQNIFIGCKDGLLISKDGGLTFYIQAYPGLPANNGILSLAGAQDGNTTSIFAIARERNSMWGLMQPSEYWGSQKIYRLDWDDSPSWQVLNQGIPQSAFPFFVGMARNNPNVVYIAGATESPQNPMVYKSTNRGANWSPVFQTQNNANIATGWAGAEGDLAWGWMENAMGFDVSNTDPNVAVITDWGFVHTTKDGGNTWQQAYIDTNKQHSVGSITQTKQAYTSIGIENTSSWWLHWTDINSMIAAYTDIAAIKSNNGGHQWSFNYSGYAQGNAQGDKWNSTYHIVEAEDGTLYSAVSSLHDIYQSTYLHDSQLDHGDGAILKSTDKGSTWSLVYDFDMPVIKLALDPKNKNVLYACAIHSNRGGVYKTINLNTNQPTFIPTNSPPRTQGHPYDIKVLDDGVLVTSYSGRRDQSWNFTASSGVFMSENKGVTWIDVSDAGMYYWTKDIIIEPHDTNQNTWYAAVHSGWGGAPNGLGGLYKTINRGQSWERILELDRVESATIHPANPSIMYVTTEYEGLWFSENLEDNNSPDFHLLKEYPFQHPMRVFFNPFDNNEIWITSFGFGMSTGKTISTPTHSIPQSELPSFYPNPFSNDIHLETKGKTDLSIIDINGKCLLSAVIEGSKRLDLSHLPTGIYTFIFQKENSVHYQKSVKVSSH